MSTNSTALVLRDDQSTFDEWQVAALRQIGVDQASPADLAVFFHTCKRTGLDPFARQVYMIRRGGKQTMQTGIDGLRLVAQRTAERTRETFGYEDTMWADDQGVWHDVWLGAGTPAAARVAVIRNGQRFPAVAMFKEYAQSSPNWREKPALMLAKCAEAAALRKAFPMDLSGIYTPDEVSDEPEVQQRPRGMDAVRAAAGATEPDEPEHVEATLEPDETGEALTDHTRRKMFALLGDVGETDPGAQRAGMTRILGREVTSRGDLTEVEGQQVCDSLRPFIASRDADAAQRGEA